MEIISSNNRSKIRVFLSPQLFHFVSEFLARSIKKEKTWIEIGQEFK
jgi:hypothetical protein